MRFSIFISCHLPAGGRREHAHHKDRAWLDAQVHGVPLVSWFDKTWTMPVQGRFGGGERPQSL